MISMPQSFPAPPSLPTHNWVDPLKQPEVSSVEKRFAGGQRSSLILSNALVGAEFVAHWDNPQTDFLSGAQMRVLVDFWRSINTHGSFLLPPAFWPVTAPPAVISMYSSASPTGYWRFKEAPITERVYADRWSALATLVGVID